MQHKDCERYDFDILFTYIYETRWAKMLLRFSNCMYSHYLFSKQCEIKDKTFYKKTHLKMYV